jgi:two-component system sensor histidine kinase YesM
MLFKKISFQKKIYLYVFTLNLVLLFSCSAVFYYYTTNSLKNNMSDTLISNTSMLTKDLNTLLEAADNSLKELQTDAELLAAAKAINDSTDNYFSSHVPIASMFQDAFRSVIFSQNTYGSISYVSKYYDNVGFSKDSGAYAYLKKPILKDHAEISRLFYDTAYVSYVAPHEDYWGHKTTVFSVVRSMRDTFRRYGLFILDFDSSTLDNLLGDFENPDDYSISILDADGSLVYTGDENIDKDQFYLCYQDALKDKADTFSSDNLSLSCYEVSDTSGWTFILTTSTASYLDSMKQLLVISAALFFSLFVVMSTFLFFVTHQLAKPVKQLSHQLMTLEPGKNISLQQTDSSNEITILTNAVQGFLAEIYNQNQRLTEARRRTMQAHYAAMEAQLNPHFLYNTLSVIGMTGLANGNTTVSRMCSELANLLRYSLSYTGQSVRLEQEITNAESYLYIMKMRYEDDLVYEWDMDDSLKQLHVPKLILQPLIENCFQHGFRQTEQEVLPPWKLRIRSYKDDTRWYLSISNNGAAFDLEKRRQLYERIHQFTLPQNLDEDINTIKDRQGYGLENTILRLNIYYHGGEYFEITEIPERWTTVIIGGPLSPEHPLPFTDEREGSKL